jgi:hypothetical protein
MNKSNEHWTIKQLFKRMHLIEFPEYQREPNVWNLEKKQRLIDSILRDFDIASIYLFKKEDATYGYAYDCIDGRQRINAILSYLEENKRDKEDNGFHLTMANEIYDDLGRFGEVNNKRFKNLPREWQDRIWNYPINVVEIDHVENEEELNLLFLRLQLGQILNAGEKLHAMTGEMRDYIFNDIGRHDFFKGIRIPYRRYAREQVAAQIALNYFSRKETGQYHRSRYIDLQEFFKERSRLSKNDSKLTDEIRQKLDMVCQYLKDELYLVGNRAIAVSLFLFVSELIDQSRENEIAQFAEFLVKFMKTLKWQIPKGVQMDAAYHYLLDFQTYVTQAAGEKYAIQNRHDFLSKGFYYYKRKKAIEGDDKYFEHTGGKADEEREKVKL